MIVVPVMVGAAIMMNRRMMGLSRLVIEGLVVELAPRWQARHRDRLAARTRRREIGAGAKHRFAFKDRLLATLVHLRHGLTHDVVAAWFGVHRSTITRSVAEVRPLLAERGCRVPDGVRLRTLADVVAYLGHHPQALMDATEVRVRRPVEGRAGRNRSVSGKARLNTMKALVICDPAGRLLFCGETPPGPMHDLTQARTAGLVDLLLHTPIGVQVLADAGYQGLGTDTAGAVITPRPKPRKGQKSLPPSVIAAHDAARKRHSSQRIRVEHVIGHLKNWRILARYHGRREHFDASIRAIAGPLSDHQHTDRTEHTTKRPKALPATAHHR
ncbi:transposase family protein [Micromonospora sp. NPDC023633]|uniref:transposase family protein n=1 Tax=Micromonospora sp. NPDC023633 TaxID=3154320 RepID=UPI0033CCF516